MGIGRINSAAFPSKQHRSGETQTEQCHAGGFRDGDQVVQGDGVGVVVQTVAGDPGHINGLKICLLYTSDAADE